MNVDFKHEKTQNLSLTYAFWIWKMRFGLLLGPNKMFLMKVARLTKWRRQSHNLQINTLGKRLRRPEEERRAQAAHRLPASDSRRASPGRPAEGRGRGIRYRGPTKTIPTNFNQIGAKNVEFDQTMQILQKCNP